LSFLVLLSHDGEPQNGENFMLMASVKRQTLLMDIKATELTAHIVFWWWPIFGVLWNN